MFSLINLMLLILAGVIAVYWWQSGLFKGRARELAGTILSADTESPVLVNGRPGRATQVLAAGDTFEIVHHAGEKGALRWMFGSR